MTVNDEIPESENKDFIYTDFFSSQMICAFLLAFFFFNLSFSSWFSGTTPGTCAVWGAAQTAAVIGQAGPRDPTADFVG